MLLIALKKLFSMPATISKIIKRDGSAVNFDANKITAAIDKAFRAVGEKDGIKAKKITNNVIKLLAKKFGPKKHPNVEEVQDAVEKVLIDNDYSRVAKAYILYRQKRSDLRLEKARILEKDVIDEVDKRFDSNALRVLKSRYLRNDENGKLVETPKELFTRIAVHIALPDLFYDDMVFDKSAKSAEHPKEEFDHIQHATKLSIGKYKLNKYHLEALKRMYDRFNTEKKMKVSWEKVLELLKKNEFNKYEKNIDEYYNSMVTRKFMPNTPAIVNFGNPLGMGSACFVIDVEDSIDGIMDSLKSASIIFKAGGGVGYNFSKLRPEGDFVKTTHRISSGPVSFMQLFDAMTDTIKQGGVRRGANMGIMNISHPDIEHFITAKQGNKALRNFNISVLVFPDFWDYYKKNKPYPLINPRNGQIVKHVDPKELFDRICYQAWESAEPGVIFFDHVNKYNPFLKGLGPIVTTNPCVTSDTLVSTENGLERIDSLTSDYISVDNRLVDNGDGLVQIGTQNVKLHKVIKTGIKDTFKLETESGYELVATSDHRIMTDNGWKQLSELTLDDYVYIQSGEGRFTEERKLPFEVNNEYVGKNGRMYKLNLPTELTKELGLILGWLVGDGFVGKDLKTMGMVFSPNDQEAKKIIQPVFENYCNRKIKPSEYENGCQQLRSSSKHVIDFFLNLGYDVNERAVPKSIFTAPKDVVVAFLMGLFSSDGTIGMGDRSRNYIRLNSSSMKLLKQVQLLLLNLGVKTTIYDRSTKPKIFDYTNKNGKTIKYQTSGKNYELNVSKENLPRFLSLVSFIQKKNIDKSTKLLDFEFYKEKFLDKVKNVEHVGEREVWDLQEPVTHSFIANGIIAHNCGEVLLYPNESCNLGSINVWSFVKKKGDKKIVDWDGLKDTIMLCTKFLDNVIDVNKYPLKEIEEMTLGTRKVGLGIMGLADLMFELGLTYNSDQGREFMEKLMEFVNYYSKIKSIELARLRGPVPFLDKSFYPDGKLPFAGFYDKKSWHFNWDEIVAKIKEFGIRNGFTTVIAPTGSISMIAGTSSGMEPMFSLVFEKNVKVGSFYYIDPVFEEAMRDEGLYDEDLIKAISDNRGSIKNIKYVPEKMKKVFVTAMDITPEDHIRALAAFQKWTDSSISKTNNFPADATVEDMRKSYMLAYELGCKDVTVYRDTSIKQQVLSVPKKDKAKESDSEEVERAPQIALETPKKKNGKCPNDGNDLVFKEGCMNCLECGYGYCTSA